MFSTPLLDINKTIDKQHKQIRLNSFLFVYIFV